MDASLKMMTDCSHLADQLFSSEVVVRMWLLNSARSGSGNVMDHGSEPDVVVRSGGLFFSRARLGLN